MVVVYTPKQGTTAKVLEIIRDDPGVSLRHIHDRLGDDVTATQIRNSLAFLRRTKVIVNLGKHARGASWYPKDV